MNLSKASPIEVSDAIVSELPPLVMCQNILYSFNGKEYESLTDFAIGQHIYNMYVKTNPESWSPNKSSSITQAIKYHPSIKLIDEFDNYEDYTNLNNGILRFSDRTLLPHDPGFYFTTHVAVDYIPPTPDNPSISSSPALTRLLDTIFTEDDGSPDVHTIDNILQLGGYLIYPKIKMEKMFIFYGGGSNGKSMLIDYAFKIFFDKKFISSLSLNVLSKEESPSRKQLMTSRVNFATEQKTTNALESDELKKVITGEDISIMRKYEDTITFAPKCKILIAGNRFMRFHETSEGIRRRLLIFNFKNRFETNRRKYLAIANPREQRVFPAGNKDAMVEALYNERSAILNMFLDGLERLRNNNWQFIESDNSIEIFGEYLEESDYLGTWLQENFEPDEAKCSRFTAKEMQNSYREWWEYNFPDKKFDTSTNLISRKIRDIFRIQPEYVKIMLNNNHRSTVSAFFLKYKENKDNLIWNETPSDSSRTQTLPYSD